MAIYIDNEKKSVKDVISLLGIGSKIPANMTVDKQVFKLNRVEVDRENGGFRFKKSFGGTPQFNAYSKTLEKSITIRYAQSQIQRKDSEPRYSPSYLALEPDEEGNILVKSDIEFFFWYIHPSHQLSPLRDPNSTSPSEYKYLNKDAIASSEIELEEHLLNAMSVILGEHAWNIFKLRQFAKGIKVSGIDQMTDSQVKAVLKDLAKKDPVVFYNQTRANVSILNGAIQDAIDKNVLQKKNLNGLTRWYLEGEELVVITYGQDEKEAIFNYVTENYQVIYPKIVNALSGKTVDQVINRAENNALFHGPSDATEKLNEADQKAALKDLNKKSNAIDQVDQDENFRKQIQERVNEYQKLGDSLHHMKKKWLEDNEEAVKYYLENYAAVTA